MSNQFKTVSINASDYEEYEELRELVSKDLGMKLSMPQLLKLGMTYYKQRRKFDAKAVK